MFRDDQDPEEELRNRVRSTLTPEPEAPAPPAPPAFEPGPSDAPYPDGIAPDGSGGIAGRPPNKIGIPGGPERPGAGPTIEAAPQAQSAQAPSGWNQTKWEDPSHTTTKYEVGRILSNFPSTADGLKAAMAQIQAKYPGVTLSGDDTLMGLPGTMGPVDVKTAGNQWWWGDEGGMAAERAAAGGGGAVSANSGGSGGGGSAPSSAYNDQIRALLMQRLAAASAPIDENATGIAASMSAARDETSRVTDRERTEQAERLYATGGLNTGELGQKMQQSAERNATGLSTLHATLLSREVESKRNELQSYMQMALASGDAEMARQYGMQIAQLNATVQREGMGLNLAQFMAQLNQNAALAGLHG